MENKQILFGALAAVSAAAVVYYLSADNAATTTKFDPKIHTEERMMQLMDELKLEYTCIYVRHYNLIKRM
jgi:predicted transcriptional regulator